MQLSFKSLLYIAATATTIVNAAIIGSDTVDSPDAIAAGMVCSDPGVQGDCETLSVTTLPSPCAPLPGGLSKTLTSLKLNAGFTCTFYVSATCDVSAAQGFAKILPTGAADFSNMGYNNALQSFTCACENNVLPSVQLLLMRYITAT
ncbi:hypothetical protein BDP27DRAFT_1362744 [Rhodocollybia butyracea]|uniref:Uncharacterized protein n=1 Tax=Rhodocollybia butyracea TaxID=206335 RepID=A0A9P5PY39_9AGAR|nr:hypothetical protein BDP27DRAFT_1362744 [Rhodocollybia butyracea]